MTLVVASEIDRFRDRAVARLRPNPPALLDPDGSPRGDHSLDGIVLAAAGQPRPAAVLVPVVWREGAPAILLTERASGLRNHSGQIAFPGGKMDPTDPHPLATALREAEEEIGLHPRHVEPVGYLDPYLSSSNFFVVPAVAIVRPGFTLAINPDEVAETFEVPLEFLMDEVNHELHCRELKERIRQYYAMPFGHRYIWGLTAAILRNMYERLYGGEPAAR